MAQSSSLELYDTSCIRTVESLLLSNSTRDRSSAVRDVDSMNFHVQKVVRNGGCSLTTRLCCRISRRNPKPDLLGRLDGIVLGGSTDKVRSGASTVAHTSSPKYHSRRPSLSGCLNYICGE